MFNWIAYYELAEELGFIEDATEAELRTSISRSYYAVFNIARKLLEEEGVRIQKDGAHGRVWARFRAEGKIRKRISDDGKRLKDKREDADYEDIFANPKAEAKTVIALANKTIDALRTEGAS